MSGEQFGRWFCALLLILALAGCRPGSDTAGPSGKLFERFGTEPHVLWWYVEDGETEELIRRRLEQMMVDRGWFMYESADTAVFNASMLHQFDLIILSTSSASRANSEEFPVQALKLLDEFEARGGEVHWVGEAGALHKLL